MPITAISRLLQAMMRHNFTFALLSHIPADRIPGEWSTLAALQGRWLTRKGQLVEAEAVLTRAKKRWPSDGHIAINHAFVAEARGDLGAFAERWRAILGHHPDLPLAHAGLGGALRKLGRLEQAHDVLKAAQARFPEDTHIAMESAWLAHDRGEHLDAIALWQRFSVQSPERFEGPLGLSTALRALLRFDEADQVLEAAIQRFPGVPVLASNHAVNADARGDRPLALARWQRVLEDFPDEPISHAGVGEPGRIQTLTDRTLVVGTLCTQAMRAAIWQERR